MEDEAWVFWVDKDFHPAVYIIDQNQFYTRHPTSELELLSEGCKFFSHAIH